jgi:DNA-binding NarL/FixJ family response regulator
MSGSDRVKNPGRAVFLQQQKEPEMATATLRKPWTDVQTKTLKLLIKKGWRARQIANRLKRTPGAIAQKKNTLGLKTGTHGRRAGTTIKRGTPRSRHRTRS